MKRLRAHAVHPPSRSTVSRAAVALSVVLVAGQLAAAAPAAAAPAAASQKVASPAMVDVGSAGAFSVLSGAAVVSTGNATVLSGDLGLSPTGAITGFGVGLGVVQGTVHNKDDAAELAQVDSQAAYDDAAGRAGATAMTGDQIGSTFAPGVYSYAASFANTGAITLDAGGDPDAVFIFQMDAAFSPAAGSSVLLADGAKATNVFWASAAAVTIGADSQYLGTFLSADAVTLGNNVTIKGRVLSDDAVTLANNVITKAGSTPPDPAETLAVTLGDASPFGVLGNGVGSGGATAIDGDIGSSPTGVITGFPAGTLTGEKHDNDDVADAAQEARKTAYDEAAARTTTGYIAGDQGGLTFGPGVYRSSTAFANNSTITLDGGGDPQSVFIFQVNAAFSPAAGSAVELTNGAAPENVFYQVLGGVTLGPGSSYPGTFLAHGAISFGPGITMVGRLLSNAAVTLSTTAVDVPPIDVTKPVITIDGGPKRTTKDATPLISGTTGERVGTVVTVTVGRQELTTKVLDGGIWRTTAGALGKGLHTVLAEVTDPGSNTGRATQALTVAGVVVQPGPAYRPDVSIKRPGGKPVGVGVYGGAARQRVASAFYGPVKSIRFDVKLHNRGTLEDRITIIATARLTSFKVAYWLGGKDVTSAITRRNYRTKVLAPGQSMVLAMVVTRTKTSMPGDRGAFRILTGSGRAPGPQIGKRDAVGAVVTVPRTSR